ncbi:MAG: hypothetical protein Q8P07_01430 [bacterium]|nr:hypothetical protein [bacterium]
MSSEFKFQLAGEVEDDALRAVLCKVPTPGNISLVFNCEPSFYVAEHAGSVKSQTLIYKDQKTGMIAGIAGRSIRNLYIDGVQKTVGYLNNLKLLPEVRSGTVFARGYKQIHDFHGDGEAPYYFATILDENKYAQQILESGRAGIPNCVFAGMFVTYLIPLRKRALYKLRHEIIPCDESTLLKAHSCLSEWNSRYQFAPVYTPDDISGRTRLLPNFSPDNLYICKEGDGVAGTLGVWNQQPFKQMIVAGYSARMKTVRPFYNIMARLNGHPTLPNIGEHIKCVYASLISSKEDDSEVFKSLICKARSDWSGRGHDYLLVGLSVENKLAAVARSLAARELKSRIYLIHWPEEKAVLPKNGRVAHLEVATL